MAQMQELSPEQVQGIAQTFHDVAAAIGDYRIGNALTLPDATQKQLQDEESLCFQCSNRYLAMGISMEQDTLDATAQQIEDLTAQAEDAISRIKTADKVLQIATAAAVLGASIASLNPSAVSSGIQGLVTALKGPDPDDATSSDA